MLELDVTPLLSGTKWLTIAIFYIGHCSETHMDVWGCWRGRMCRGRKGRDDKGDKRKVLITNSSQDEVSRRRLVTGTKVLLEREEC